MTKKLELFRPVKPFRIDQRFGENNACYNPNTNIIIALPSSKMCPSEYVSFYPYVGMKGHNGLDLTASDGTSVYAAQDGTVEAISLDPERGLGIDIITPEPYQITQGEYHIKHRYWHLKKVLVNKGDKVFVGQWIGLADNTGKSAGSHLHFEIKPVKKNLSGEWYNIFPLNGYYGAVNPEPYIIPVYGIDMISLILSTKILIEKVANFIKLRSITRFGSMQRSTYSLTYIGIITFVIGYLFNLVGVPFVEGNLQTTISFIFSFVGVIQALYGRWRIGDLNIFGARIEK